LAITIIASLFWQQQVQVRSIENQRLQSQEQWILRAAIDWARAILKEDRNTSAVDYLGEAWAAPLVASRLDQYVDTENAGTDLDNATLSGYIVDAQSRYNLNNLATNGVPDLQEIAVYQRLLASAGLNRGLATITATTIASTQSAQPTQGGAPPDQNQSGPRPMNLEQVDDLLAIPGYTPDIVAKLQDLVVVLPRDSSIMAAPGQTGSRTAINVNTASAQVLAARVGSISLAEAATLIAGRNPNYFKDPADFWSRAGKPAQDGIDTQSKYFLMNGSVHLRRASLKVQALLDRTTATPTTLWTREN
jgi:general secretion pathway protein K